MKKENEGGLRKPGRPVNSGSRSYSGKCDVRLDKQELSMLDRLTNDNRVSKSDVMRKALRSYFNYCTDSEE